MLSRTRRLYHVAADASKILDLDAEWQKAREAFAEQRLQHIAAVIEEVYGAITTTVESADPSVAERVRRRLLPRADR
jgi:methionyl-tRNA synthetase